MGQHPTLRPVLSQSRPPNLQRPHVLMLDFRYFKVLLSQVCKIRHLAMEPAFTSICEKNVSFSKELSEVKRGIVIAKLFKFYFINYSKKKNKTNKNTAEHTLGCDQHAVLTGFSAKLLMSVFNRGSQRGFIPWVLSCWLCARLYLSIYKRMNYAELCRLILLI